MANQKNSNLKQVLGERKILMRQLAIMTKERNKWKKLAVSYAGAAKLMQQRLFKPTLWQKIKRMFGKRA